MKTQPTSQTHRCSQRGLRTGGFTPALLLALTVACGPIDEASEPPQEPGSQSQELDSQNGATLNGLAFNGLATNGLATNGLATNGLATNGMASESFQSWFQQDPALAAMVMRYLVACSLPAGETRTYTHADRTYVWTGLLGLAPDWASGQPATVTEQQLVTGCLAAHVNKYGRNVDISIQGATARGQPIPSTQQELQDFSKREGCFFGNLFTNEGIFVGNDGRMLGANESSVRACALGHENTRRNMCAPINHVDSCEEHCTRDPTNTYYTQCTLNGIAYAPITTRIRSKDIYVCGDLICQFTESCGLGLSTVQCTLDCGVCLF
jgi:hypothetical protein